MAIPTALLVMGTGCQRKAVVKRSQISLQPIREQTSPFDVAVYFMNNLDKYQPAQARDQILYNLGQWARQQKDPVDWIADPLFRRLPQELTAGFTIERLSSMEFEPFDGLMLQEAIWMRDVARSVATRPAADQQITQWLSSAANHGQLSTDDADNLLLVYRLFDWTIRNIQLDPELDDKDILGGKRERELRDQDTPRHIYHAWENLLYGHGDWLERSRVFILLARQLGFQAVMLAVDVDQQNSRPKPWTPAVLLGEDLYLFDPLLGFPLPGPDTAPIGRLADYLDSPQLLEGLSSQSHRYRVNAADLERLVANIDATPGYLSQRMKLVESRLTGDSKTVLTVTPTTLSRKLRACRGIARVEIWTFPYEGYRFYDMLRQSPNDGLVLRQFLQMEQRPFLQRRSDQGRKERRKEEAQFALAEWLGGEVDPTTKKNRASRAEEQRSGDILQGRLLQFRGDFRGDEDRAGATTLLMDCRIPNRALAQFDAPLSSMPPESPALENLPDDPPLREQAYKARMQFARASAIWQKNLATYWLGLMAYEKQSFQVAADYFKKRILDAELDSPWRQSARYNLARCYEQIGIQDQDEHTLALAIDLYEEDDKSPQHAGNLLRASRLRELQSTK